MKNTLLLAVGMVLFVHSFCQTGGTKNTLSVSPGISFPVGGFASTTAGSNSAGYARAGESLDIAFVHKLNSHFGITAVLYGQRNGVNNSVLEQQLGATKFALPIFYTGSVQQMPPPVYTYYPQWHVDKASWYAEGLLIGATCEFPFAKAKGLAFTARATVGVAHVSMPAFNGRSITDTAAAYIKQNSGSAFSPSFLVSAGIKYQLRKKLALIAGLDFFGTGTVTFKNITETLTTLHGFGAPGIYTPSNAYSISVTSITSNQKQPVASVNVHAGIALTL